MRFRVWLLVALLCPAVLRAQECRPLKTALVLSGGGVKGLAHIGVLEVLDRLGVRPDLIVGTSMGAIIGGLYASGYSADQIDSLTRALPISEVVRPFRTPAPHPWDHRIPLLFMVRGKNGFTFQTGIVDEAQPNARLNQAMLRGNLLARGRFDRLPIPFRAVATDLRDRRTVVLDSGDLARAVRASSAIPLVFPPVVLDSAILVDGGLSANIPVEEARSAGAERVIVVDVTEHRNESLDPESPIALADQLLGFMFQQPAALLREGDIYVRPAVQGFKSLDFSPESMVDVRRRGRQAADSTVGRAQCLPRGSVITPPPSAVSLGAWVLPNARSSDSALVTRLLRLDVGARLDPVAFGKRLVGLADAEGLRGVWLNPSGEGNDVRFTIEPIRAPSTVGGAGVGYDNELGAEAWAGLFSRGLLGTTLEVGGLASVGRFAREVYGTASWHLDAGLSRVTPIASIRVRDEEIRRFDASGLELPELDVLHGRAAAGVEIRGGRALRVRLSGEAFGYGGATRRGATAFGGSLRVERVTRIGWDLRADAAVTDSFQWARVAVARPTVHQDWTVTPVARLGWGADLPPQWTMPLGGEDGFPGLHLGERRGSREIYGAIKVGYRALGPVELRLTAAVGRAWIPGPGAADWIGGARVGLGAETPAGPIDVAYGLATIGRAALYLRIGAWF